MSECVSSLHKKSETISIDSSVVNYHTPMINIPQTYLHIMCPCGKEHRIDLSSLTQSTIHSTQVKEECDYARHFVVHSGHAKYRKILIASEFGEK